MTHKIKKQNIFNFLKAQGIIKEIKNTTKIFETTADSSLKELNILNLNKSSNYWQFQTENNTFLEPKTKKVDGVIIEETSEKILRIVLIELKSKKIIEHEVIEKFEQSLSWIYLLLNLLYGKENKEIEIFGILAAQKNKNWNTKSDLYILNSTSIRYIKRSFFTAESYLDLNYNELVNKI